jgi:ABC-type multidrug transport system fused ATPase/permease subunit
MEKRFLITDVLKPHWKALTVAFVAVTFESLADVLEPWPIKIVLDYVIESKHLPRWLGSLARIMPGNDKHEILIFAAIAVIVVAIVGAFSSYTGDYLTTKVGQWVMHDLRHDLYHHIQRLSFSDYDRQRTGDLISRITSDIDANSGFRLFGSARNRDGCDNARRDDRNNVFAQLAIYADSPCDCAAPVPGGLQYYATQQACDEGRSQETRRDRVGCPGGTILDARGQGIRPRGL